MAIESSLHLAAEIPADSKSTGPFRPRHDAPAVSIIIPHYDDLENLRRCMSLLAAQTMPRDRFEIIVADNNSHCGIAAVEEICKGVADVVPAPIQGAGEARNAGVRASRGRCFAFIDSDCRPSPDWLERGVEALAHADMVGGSVEIDVTDPENPTAVEAFEMVFAFNSKRYIEKMGFSVTANMFVSRAIFNKVGGFRAGIAEDFDWGHRAVALGYRWRYEPGVRVSHPARRDWDDLARKWRRLVRESYKTTRERPFGQLRWAFRTWLVLFSPFLHSVLVIRSTKLNRLDLRLKAIGILFRLRWWRVKESYAVMFAKQ